MKKKILILTVLLAILWGTYYMRSDKKMMTNFACDVTNDAIKLEDVIVQYLLCNKNAKTVTLLQLEYFRTKYKKIQLIKLLSILIKML